MQTISLYFQVHQPFRFRNYRFFEIGNDHYYYDDYQNESILLKVAEKCYLPANQLMLDLVNKYDGKFKLSFSISGVALDQFELYAPEVIESFKRLAETGHVEFLSETYSHSLVSLKNKDEFRRQVESHKKKIKELFNVEPKVFRNTELIYSDEIGNMVSEMGYTGMLTEGAKHVLGWKSPNYVYTNAVNPKLKVLLKNFKLSDDIAFRFSNPSWAEYPLTTEKFVGWLKALDKKEEVINLFMDYETFGEHQWAETGIFEFLKALPNTVFSNTKIGFSTPSEIFENNQPVGSVNVPNPISWADEERDLTAWLGNPLQEQAFNKLYSLLDTVRKIDDPILNKDFDYLQVSDHFYYMATKFLSDGDVHSYFNPYNSPYEAFINYMNVLSDFEIRLNAIIPISGTEELVRMNKIIAEKDSLIQKYKMELKLQSAKQRNAIHPLPKAPARNKPAKKTPVKASTKKSPGTVKNTTGKKTTTKKSK